MDPFGLSRLTMRLSNGEKIIIENPSASALIDAINSVEDGKIMTFQLAGHGNEFSQCISAGLKCKDELTKNLALLSNGVLVENIKDALLRKMNSKGDVRLEGCNNASGDLNMVRSISEHLSNIPVKGGYGYQLGYENHWIFGNSSESFGLKRVYVNGVLR